MDETEAIRVFAGIALFLSICLGALFSLIFPGSFLAWLGITGMVASLAVIIRVLIKRNY
jgi:hypothetical protein